MNIPTLTTEQRQSITILLQQVEITQLRLEAAQREAKHCQEAAQQQLRALNVEGYQLDLQRMEYIPVQKPADVPPHFGPVGGENPPEKVDL